MTPSIVEGLRILEELAHPQPQTLSSQADEPRLDHVAVGNPVSHSQVIHLWRALNSADRREYTLEMLLRGSKIYVPPPAPKREPSDEYKALMARLRREQEQREYERMAGPLPPTETFSQRFTNGTARAQAFAAVNRPNRDEDIGDDDVTYSDVHRQLMLILNFVASILGVAATLWILARWWSTPARLFLTMGGSVLVGIAEVAVYSGYVWHLGQAKKKDEAVKEVKEIVNSWAMGAEEEPVVVGSEARSGDTSIRRRQKGTK